MNGRSRPAKAAPEVADLDKIADSDNTGSGDREPEPTPELPRPGDKPCLICGTRLGWAMVRRGLTVHKPECPQKRPGGAA